jgi:hypothetical protein
MSCRANAERGRSLPGYVAALELKLSLAGLLQRRDPVDGIRGLCLSIIVLMAIVMYLRRDNMTILTMKEGPVITVTE